MSYATEGYIVPRELLAQIPQGVDWDETPIKSDPTLSFVVVRWDNFGHEAYFEALADVRHIGRPWEDIDPDILAMLGSLDATDGTLTSTLSANLPTTSSSTPQTVYSVLKNLAWGPARLIR